MRFGERTKLFLRSCLGVGDEKRPFYIFLHVPKCAGSTINFHIQEKYSIKSLHLPTMVTPILTGLNEVPWATREWLDASISHLPEARRRSIRIVYGHLAYLGIHNLFRGEPRYFTFLRNPVDRVISQYNWGLTENARIEGVWGVRRQSGDIVPFRDWLASSGRAKNLMVKCLSMAYSGTPSPGEWGREATYEDLEKSKEMLEQCYFVGLTEKISDFRYIFNELGLGRHLGGCNSSVKYYIPDEESRHLTAAHNALDCELYDYACQLKKEG